jgi:hypothetical protein
MAQYLETLWVKGIFPHRVKLADRTRTIIKLKNGKHWTSVIITSWNGIVAEELFGLEAFSGDRVASYRAVNTSFAALGQICLIEKGRMALSSSCRRHSSFKVTPL